MITEREKSAGRTTNHESKLPNGKPMTREDIIRMTRQAGGYLATEGVNWMPIVGIEYAEKFAALVAAHEREACRLIVLDNSDAEGICCTDDVLEAFRQRGEI
jgi:hypothetical protein